MIRHLISFVLCSFLGISAFANSNSKQTATNRKTAGDSGASVSASELRSIKQKMQKSAFIRRAWRQMVPDKSLTAGVDQLTCSYNNGMTENNSQILCKTPVGDRPYEVCSKYSEEGEDECETFASAPEFSPSSFYFRVDSNGRINRKRSPVIQKTENFDYNAVFCHFFDSCAA